MVNDVYKTFLTYILSKYKDSQENKNHKEYYYYLLLNNMHYSFQDKLDLINNDKFKPFSINLFNKSQLFS